MGNIASRTDSAALKAVHEKTTPIALYLGRDECREIMQLRRGEDGEGYREMDAARPGEMKFMGLPVFRVLEQSHFHIATEPYV